MKIKINYKTQFKRFSDTVYDVLDIEESLSLNDFLLSVSNQKPLQFKNLLFEENDSRRESILIFIDGQQVETGKNPSLDRIEEITLMTPISGG